MRLTPHAFLECWDGPLVRPSLETLGAIQLPAYAREFLLLAGLPAEAGDDLTFLPLLEGMRKIDFEALQTKYIRSLYSLGAYRDTAFSKPLDLKILAVEEGFGRIYAASPHDNFVQFCNSGIPELASCLLVLRPAFFNPPKDFSTVHLEAIRTALFAADPPAFGDPESHWSVTLECAADQLQDFTD